MSFSLQYLNRGAFPHVTEIDSPESLPNLVILTGVNGSGKSTLLRAINELDVVLTDESESNSHLTSALLTDLEPELRLDQDITTVLRHEQHLCSNRRSHSAQGGDTRQSAHPWGQLPSNHPLLEIASLWGKSVNELSDAEIGLYAGRTRPPPQTATGVPYADGAFDLSLAAVSMNHLRAHYHSSTLRGDGMDAPELPVPPWKRVSELLKRYGFEVRGPEVNLRSASEDLKLGFYSHDTEVSPEVLSGGERALVALALGQYSLGTETKFPRVLLLDESLAKLHPSLLHETLETLQREFVNHPTAPTKIIVATHSPSLVAIAPPGSVHECSLVDGKLTISSIEKSEAISKLTYGIPTLNVELQHRRQVFVESQHDQLVHSSLLEAVREHLKSPVSLAFIPSKKSKSEGGNCADVKNYTEKLMEGGSKTVRGLIDWDLNTSEAPDGVVYLCEGERYSIENLVLDPLILCGTLSLSSSGRNHVDGKALDQIQSLKKEALQELVDSLLGHVQKNLDDARDDVTRTDVHYINGRTLRIPKWYLHSNGHDLAKAILSSFPCLEQIRAGNNNDKSCKLVAGIAKEKGQTLRHMFPVSLLETFQKLQEPL